jgi:hypothetical protein
LTKIHGVGAETAQRWFAQGVRSVDDVVQKRIPLTHTQRVGLAMYSDKQKRIPRAEVRAITDLVALETSALWFNATVVCCGLLLSLFCYCFCFF